MQTTDHPVLPTIVPEPEPARMVAEALRPGLAILGARLSPDEKTILLYTSHGPAALSPVQALKIAAEMRKLANGIGQKAHERQARARREGK